MVSSNLKANERTRKERERRENRTLSQKSRDAMKRKAGRKPLTSEQKAVKAQKERERRAGRTTERKAIDHEKAKIRRCNQTIAQQESQAEKKRALRASRSTEEIKNDAEKAKQRRNNLSDEIKEKNAEKKRMRRINMIFQEKRLLNLTKSKSNFQIDPIKGYWDFGGQTVKCESCGALRYLGERFKTHQLYIQSWAIAAVIDQEAKKRAHYLHLRLLFLKNFLKIVIRDQYTFASTSENIIMLFPWHP